VTGAVHGLRQYVELAALRRAGHLDPDVKDRAPLHQADRIEAGLRDEQELVDAEIRGVEALAILLHALDPGSGIPASDFGSY
jgi:hypothetical protein